MSKSMPVRNPAAGAFATAAIAAPALWILAFVAWTLVTEGPVRAFLIIPYLLMGAVLFGVPVILGVLLLIALPALLVLRRFVRITPVWAVTIGAAAGLLGREAVRIAWAEPEILFMPIPVVIVAGAGAAAAWWRVWNGLK